jgi:acetyl-CoA acetyltransferase
MHDVAIIGYAQSPQVREARGLNEVEMLMPVLQAALADAHMPLDDIDFVCSGSCDYIAGGAFSFVGALDAVGATPCKQESHVEMDAAWALYESWLKIQSGHIKTALIYGFAKASNGSLPDILSQQLDPYYLAPLWPDSISLAALQANLLLQTGRYTERDFAQVVADSRRHALANPNAQLKAAVTVDTLLAEPILAPPLRKHDCCPISDGAAAMVIARGDVAESLAGRPVYIRGVDHRMEVHQLGQRDLTTSVSTSQAAERAGVGHDKIDLAELYAPFSPQTLILRHALRLPTETLVNPSGGPLAGHIFMCAGLDRFGEAARRIGTGAADRAVAHATSGPCLQHNMVAVLEGK